MSGAYAIDSALAVHGIPSQDGDIRFRAGERPCEGAKFHSPRPLITELVRHGTVEAVLCHTCKANLEVLVYLSEQEGELSWTQLREFGNQLRALGRRVIEEGVPQ
jgi:hypothetical protein